MSDNLNTLEQWAGTLLAKLQPAQRRTVNRKVATELRRNQMRRVAAQQAPDGAAYVARKKRTQWRAKVGRIKRQKAAMFKDLRKTKYLKIKADQRQLTIGYFGWIARVARIHQEGLEDRVAKGGPRHRYAARPLLGLNEGDRTLIREALLRHLTAL